MMCNECGIREKYGRSGRCKPCKNAYNKIWYEQNKDKHKADARRNAERYKERYTALVNTYKSKGCTDCGVVYPPHVMDFDHLEDSVKVTDVSRMSGWSLAKLQEEIAKCEVVCANCHRERTHQRRKASTV